MAEDGARRPRIVVVGAGFGGLKVVRKLSRQNVDITLVDRRNYHLFQPLLYQVATAALSPADVAWPIRSIFRNRDNVSVVLGTVIGIDKAGREVITEEQRIPYDYLVVATGAVHSYFGRDDWAPFAPGLKRIVDATEIRKRVLLAFERAETAATLEKQRQHLSFVVVGGGATGVEMAGGVAELARMALVRDFRRIDPTDARIVLVEATDRLLPHLAPKLSAYAKTALEKLGVEVWLNKRVDDVSAEGARISGEMFPASTIIWGAGVAVPNVGRWLACETDASGRAMVLPDLSIAGTPEVFVIGDAAHVPWKAGRIVPGIAPAAKQEGGYVAAAILAAIEGKAKPRAFAYSHGGDLATIGRNKAVIDFGWLKLTGFPAWFLWGVAHIYFLIGVRAPLFVALQWLGSYVTFRKGARLITGLTSLSEPTNPPAAQLPRHAAE